jgi:hypothetical protein
MLNKLPMPSKTYGKFHTLYDLILQDTCVYIYTRFQKKCALYFQ